MDALKEGLRHTNKDGTPKQGFEHYNIAKSYAKKVQRTTDSLVEVYRCKDCRLFHFGRSNKSYAYYRKVKRIKSTEDRMVGRLIALLRGTYTGTDLLTTDPEAKYRQEEAHPDDSK